MEQPNVTLDAFQRALRARVINIAAAHFDVRDTNLDPALIDVPRLYTAAALNIVKKQQPKVILVMQHRFRAAALAILFQRFGCTTVICHNGRDAYTRYLRRFSHEFDLAIVDWDLPDVNGRDLVYYEREKGGKLVFIAALPSRMHPLDAVHGGADLFLRRPLVIHMHVFRQLLLPNLQSSYGYPAELMRRIAAAPDLRRLLDQMITVADPEVEAVIEEANADLEALPDANLDASSQVVGQLMTALKAVVQQAESAASATSAAPLGASPSGGLMSTDQQNKFVKAVTNCLNTFNQMKQEIAQLQQDNRTLLTQNVAVPGDDEPYHLAVMALKPSEIDTMSRIAALESLKRCRKHLYQIQAENDQLNSDIDRLCYFKVELEENLTSSNIVVNFVEAPQRQLPDPMTVAEEASQFDSAPVLADSGMLGASSMSPSKKRFGFDLSTMSATKLRAMALAKRRHTAPKKKLSPVEVLLEANRRLESAFMLQEDRYLEKKATQTVTSSAKQAVAGLAIPFAANLQVSDPTPIDDLYNTVASALHGFAPAVNEFMARLVASHPFLAAKCDAFVRGVTPLIKACDLPTQCENIRRWQAEKHRIMVEALNAERVARAAAQGAVKQQASGVELRAKLRGLNLKSAAALGAIISTRWQRDIWDKWFIFTRTRAMSRDPNSVLGLQPSGANNESTSADADSGNASTSGGGTAVVARNALMRALQQQTTEKKSALLEARRELVAAQKELQEFKKTFSQVDEDRRTAEQVADQRAVALNKASAELLEKSKAIADLVAKVEEQAKLNQMRSDELSRLQEELNKLRNKVTADISTQFPTSSNAAASGGAITSPLLGLKASTLRSGASFKDTPTSPLTSKASPKTALGGGSTVGPFDERRASSTNNPPLPGRKGAKSSSQDPPSPRSLQQQQANGVALMSPPAALRSASSEARLNDTATAGIPTQLSDDDADTANSTARGVVLDTLVLPDVQTVQTVVVELPDATADMSSGGVASGGGFNLTLCGDDTAEPSPQSSAQRSGGANTLTAMPVFALNVIGATPRHTPLPPATPLPPTAEDGDDAATTEADGGEAKSEKRRDAVARAAAELLMGRGGTKAAPSGAGSDSPAPDSPLDTSRTPLPEPEKVVVAKARKVKMLQAATARLEAHAQRMKAARLGIRMPAEGGAAAGAEGGGGLSRRASMRAPSRQPTPPDATMHSTGAPRHKFATKEEAEHTIATLHSSVGALHDTLGLDVNLDKVPAASSNPDVGEVLGELLKALTSAAERAAAASLWHRRPPGVGAPAAPHGPSPLHGPSRIPKLPDIGLTPRSNALPAPPVAPPMAQLHHQSPLSNKWASVLAKPLMHQPPGVGTARSARGAAPNGGSLWGAHH